MLPVPPAAEARRMRQAVRYAGYAVRPATLTAS